MIKHKRMPLLQLWNGSEHGREMILPVVSRNEDFSMFTANNDGKCLEDWISEEEVTGGN